MSQTKEQALRAYFSAQTEALSAREQVLSADDRKDEAIFAKVQANVYNIFATVLTVAVKTCPDEEAAGRFFRQKLEQLPANWRTSLERAKQYNDGEKIALETVKLEAAADILAAFERIWGVEA